MSTVKVLCTLEEHKEIYRILELPDRTTAENLHLAVKTAFGLDEDEVLHFITIVDEDGTDCPLVAQGRKPDLDYMAMMESEISMVNLWNSSQGIKDVISYDEITYHLNIQVQRFLKANRKEIRLVSMDGQLGSNSPWNPGEDSKLITSKPIDEINAELAKIELPGHKLREPSSNDIVHANLEEIESWKDDDGFNPFERISKMFEEDSKVYPHLPDPPEEDGDNSPLKKSSDQLNDAFYMENAHRLKIRVQVGEKTILELLSEMPRIDRYNFCKYLQLYSDIWEDDEQRVKAIAGAYKKDPTILLIPFALDDDRLEDFLKLPQLAESGEPSMLLNLSLMIYMGLGRYDSQTTTLYIAKDLPDLMSRVPYSKVSKLKQELRAFDEGFNILIKHYGMIEFKGVRDLMASHFRVEMTQTRCNLFIYMHYSLQQKVATFSVDTLRHFSCVLERGIDPTEQIQFYILYSNMINYLPIPDFQMQNWKKYGNYLEVFTGWGYLWAFFILNCRMDKDHARAYVDDIYYRVRNGAKLEDCMELISGMIHSDNAIFIRIRIWEIVLHFMLGTVQPALKGASCLQANQNPMYGVAPAGNFLRDTPVEATAIKKGTHVERMPRALQIEIGSRLFTLEYSDLAPLRKICREYPDNYDLLYILGMAYQRLDQYDDALQCYRELDAALRGKDHSLKKVITNCENHESMNPMSLWDDGVFIQRGMFR